MFTKNGISALHFCLISLLPLWDLNFSSIKIFLGIAIGQQHLIWQEHELDDESSLHDYGVPSGGTLRLVLGMRGGPINTRRVPVEPPSWSDEAGQSVADFMWPSASNKQVCVFLHWIAIPHLSRCSVIFS